MAANYRTLWKMPDPCSTRAGTRFIEEAGRTCIVICDFSLDGEDCYRIHFQGVECYRAWYDATCPLEMVSEAYGQVTEILQSDWKSQAVKDLKEYGREVDGLKHLMIYFDDGPGYEFICRSFTVEKRGLSSKHEPSD